MWHCANDFSFIGINHTDHINGNGVYVQKIGGLWLMKPNMDVTDAKQIRYHAMIN
jgi:hypothetical protein